jgi:hypothetical protein
MSDTFPPPDFNGDIATALATVRRLKAVAHTYPGVHAELLRHTADAERALKSLKTLIAVGDIERRYGSLDEAGLAEAALHYCMKE